MISSDDTIERVSKHDKTVAAIFENPVRANVKWRDIEALFEYHGGEITEGEGSRVRVCLKGRKGDFHRPHPQPDTDKGALKSVRRFLSEAGITMTKIPQQGVFNFGPYRGYHGRAEYDPQSGLWHGEIMGLRDVVTFQGKSIDELAGAFLESVEDHHTFCKSRGEVPERPFSGKFMVRVKPEVHERISVIASSTGVSLNQFVADQLEEVAAKEYPYVKTFIDTGIDSRVSNRTKPRGSRKAGRALKRKVM